MNIKSLLLCALLLSGHFLSLAGDPVFRPSDRCGTVSHMLDLKAKNPNYEAQQKIDNDLLEQAAREMSLSRQANTIYTIPVVVHVVYNSAQQNISDAQVLSQIDVLNEDFGRRNADTTNTPIAFRPVASSTNFQFCLATIDPSGAPTTGIERRHNTSVISWSQNDNVKFYSSGGLDAWNTSKYLNIWVCNLANPLLGYGQYPSAIHDSTYGVVVIYNAFGRTGTLSTTYNKGRTCTHEISHCFLLYHIWADDNGLCMTNGGNSDNVSDTPDQGDATYGCPPYPTTDNCSSVAPGIMFMNYMDYTDDRCLNMFTAGQASRMNLAMQSYYPSLRVSNRCTSSTGILEAADDFQFNIYPNPSTGIITIDMFLMRNIGETVNLRIYDMLGKLSKELVLHNPNGNTLNVDLSDQESGVYFVNLSNNQFNKTVRLTLVR